MTSHSLIEHKLRRYFYLGHEYLMYVPPSLRTSSADKKYQSDITGIKIIGKIVKKNKPEEINSIVPIILKVVTKLKTIFRYCVICNLLYLSTILLI